MGHLAERRSEITELASELFEKRESSFANCLTKCLRCSVVKLDEIEQKPQVPAAK
jgi:hypothetical protein